MGDYGYRESASPHIGLLWWAEVDQDVDYVDAANEFWGLAFGVFAGGRPAATLIGPSLAPRQLHLRAGERGWGVELAAHVFVRRSSKTLLLGQMLALETDGRWFELAGVRLAVPGVDALEDLIGALLRQGILAADGNIAAALAGRAVGYSRRSLHRHAVQASGMSPKQLEQLQRARTAYALLQDGRSLAVAAVEAGFADQAHMTRAFTALAGASPARILSAGRSPFDSRP